MLMCMAQGHNAVPPVRLQPATLRSGVKHSATEPLRYILYILLNLGIVFSFENRVDPDQLVAS